MTTRKYSSRSQQTTLTSAVTSGAVTIPVLSASLLLGGASINAGETFTVVIDPDTALEEIVEVTGTNSNSLTITRAVDMAGASPQDHSAGAVVRHMIIGRDLREANLHIEATGSYNDGTGAHTLHGLATGDGVVVGTDKEQTLTRKTLVSPILTGTLENDASITFEGTTADAFETTLTVVDPTADRTITLPNTSGTVVLKDSTDVLTNKTLTSPVISGSPTITGLGTPTVSSDAAPKSYVDSVLILQTAQATAAATSAASAATSATAAATSATSASVSATAAATSASSAAASATTAAASVASILTAATNANNSATAAATSATSSAASATAAATSATSAAASATTASNSASTATTQAAAANTSAASAAASATAAATSATSAAASVSAVATSAASALTSQTAAATSATSSANSATAAATSASSAATSASSAATSASDAAATYDNFDDRYLGSKASAPTLDNDGNTLLVGAIYWNSTTNTMHVWSGSAWVQIANTTTYTAPTVGSQTLTSGGTFSNINSLTINSTTIPTSKTLVDTDSSQTLTNKTLSGAVAAADPTVNLGIATKQYVDAVTAAQNFHPPVKAATFINVVATYNNGTDGVGATLTATSNGTIGTVDGVTLALNDRVLFKAQTSALQNGIYTVTSLGSGSTPWVLTRALDEDNSTSGEMRNGDTFFCIGGTTQGGKTFINASTAVPIIIGTSAITYSEFTTALPTQTGQSGKYLTTDGSVPSWVAIPSTAGLQDRVALLELGIQLIS
jgi:hypothetical protein